MDKKLTLSLDASIIERAKVYAQNNEVSLSKMIENYLASIVNADQQSDHRITHLVEKLSGVIRIPDDFDFKSDYADFLINKYK